MISRGDSRKIARAAEDFIAVLALLIDVHWWSILLASRHGAHDTLSILHAGSTLQAWNLWFLFNKGLPGFQGDSLSLLLPYKFGWPAGACKTTLKNKFLATMNV